MASFAQIPWVNMASIAHTPWVNMALEAMLFNMQGEQFMSAQEE